MPDIAIKIEHLSKMYRLGVIGSGMLRKDIQSWFALKLGKEDPNSKIGEERYKGDADHFWALKDISLEVKQGDRVGIIGKNGAGKSTLLKILSRITSPTEGTIKIKGKIASLLEVGTGFHAELTGRENIYLNGAILGMKKRRIGEKLDEIIAFSGIEHHIDTPVKRYSSGMYVRLAFAVAAHLDSDILIADEVLAVGDAEFQKKALGKMQDLSTGEGRTVLFVSHNMGAVRELCANGIFLSQGKISIISDIQTTINSYHNTFNQKSFCNLNDYKPNYKTFDIDVLSLEKIPSDKDDLLTFELNEEIKLRFKVYNNSSSIDAVAAVSISKIDGYGVAASFANLDNSFHIKEKTFYYIDFNIENKFLPGKYLIHFGINYRNDTVWWGTDIAQFEIINSRKAYTSKSGIMHLNYQINITQLN